ncbi:MAG: 3-carboxy-cis,cis-muconate cycloisomerase [Rhodospirillales bacterium 70-18]|nr:3-carboxy-cis,cis-muconate cycloisomerase [Rhodospirillales bacterium]OJY64199.1 MAG: 3-carboxy-cis,cis-muconate cycloisomerase [Rhodospirillales bacterium 70-18]
MVASTPDSRVFRDIFSTEAMRRVFSDEARVQYYLDIEAALARVQARLGIIPAEAAEEIVRHCAAGDFDMDLLKKQTERIGYPVLPVVQQIVARCRDGLGEWCHWGATTQDITDTATILAIRDALDLVEADIRAIAGSLAGLAAKYRDTPMAGRSNLQQATPITFGYKCAVLLAGFQRHLQRLAELRPRVLVGEFGGATGTLASLGADGLRVQAGLMAELGLGQPEIAWHTMRDRIAEVGCFLGLVTGTLGKISMDVKLMMQTEVEEVFEPFHEGRGSSSTMPQKRNPISSAYIQGCVSMVRQNVAALLEAMVEDHERATGTWQIEWIAVPEIFLLSSGALNQAKFLMGGLQVDPVRMRANLDLTKGLIQSEAVMMGLGPALGRQRAHDLVYDICREVIAGRGSFLDLLAAHPEISPHMGRAQLAGFLDPANYVGLSGEMVDRVLARGI